MLDTIFIAIRKYKSSHGKGVELQVTVSNSVYQDCLSDDYIKVASAFDLRLNNHPPKNIFGYKFKVDDGMRDSDFKIEKPTI